MIRPNINPQIFLGAIVLCPHCNQMLEVIGVSDRFERDIDPSGKANEFCILTYSDGATGRMWRDNW